MSSPVIENPLLKNLQESPVENVPLRLHRSNIKIGDHMSIAVGEDVTHTSSLLGAKDQKYLIASCPEKFCESHLNDTVSVVIFSGKEVYEFKSIIIAIDRLLGAVILEFPQSVSIYPVRKSLRIPVNLKGSIIKRSATECSIPESVLIKNISAGGLKLEKSGEFIENGTVLKISTILNPDFESEETTVVGIVRHSNRISEGHSYFVYGVEFIWVGDKEARQLQEFLFREHMSIA